MGGGEEGEGREEREGKRGWRKGREEGEGREKERAGVGSEGRSR